MTYHTNFTKNRFKQLLFSKQHSWNKEAPEFMIKSIIYDRNNFILRWLMSWSSYYFFYRYISRRLTHIHGTGRMTNWGQSACVQPSQWPSQAQQTCSPVVPLATSVWQSARTHSVYVTVDVHAACMYQVLQHTCNTNYCHVQVQLC